MTKYSQSFLTRDRADDSKATPPSTTSLVSPPIVDEGLLEAGTGVVLVDGPAGVPGVLAWGVEVEVDIVELVEAGLTGPAGFKPGRTYLLAGL